MRCARTRSTCSRSRRSPRRRSRSCPGRCATSCPTGSARPRPAPRARCSSPTSPSPSHAGSRRRWGRGSPTWGSGGSSSPTQRRPRSHRAGRAGADDRGDGREKPDLVLGDLNASLDHHTVRQLLDDADVQDAARAKQRRLSPPGRPRGSPAYLFRRRPPSTTS